MTGKTNAGAGSGNSEWELLWTNPTPSNAFYGGTKISLDLSKYKYVKITCKAIKSESAKSGEKIFTIHESNYDMRIVTFYRVNGGVDYRNISAIDSTGVSFGVGRTTTTNNDDYAIPLQIFAIK